MKTIVAVLVAVSSFSVCLAQTYAPDLVLSKAKHSEIVKVAQSDAKEFYQAHKPEAQDVSEAYTYAAGRAIKHGITATDQENDYEATFMEVLKQLEIDKE